MCSSPSHMNGGPTMNLINRTYHSCERMREDEDDIVYYLSHSLILLAVYVHVYG